MLLGIAFVGELWIVDASGRHYLSRNNHISFTRNLHFMFYLNRLHIRQWCAFIPFISHLSLMDQPYNSLWHERGMMNDSRNANFINKKLTFGVFSVQRHQFNVTNKQKATCENSCHRRIMCLMLVIKFLTIYNKLLSATHIQRRCVRRFDMNKYHFSSSLLN